MLGRLMYFKKYQNDHELIRHIIKKFKDLLYVKLKV